MRVRVKSLDWSEPETVYRSINESNLKPHLQFIKGIDIVPTTHTCCTVRWPRTQQVRASGNFHCFNMYTVSPILNVIIYGDVCSAGTGMTSNWPTVSLVDQQME